MEEDAVNSHSVSEISIQKVKWPDIQTGAWEPPAWSVSVFSQGRIKAFCCVHTVGLVLISFAGRLENMQLKNISQNYIPQYTKYLNNVIKCVVRKWLPIYYISINIWNRHFIVVEIFEKFIFWKYNIKH